jgi:CRP-like cAMP-binding protein
MARGTTVTSASNCFTCQARNRTEWCVLDDRELSLINDGKISKNYLPGEPIFFEGDDSQGIYCVESGMVGVRKSDADGNSVLLNIFSTGDTLGYRAFLAEEEYQAGAEALEPCTICFVDRATVRALLEQNPALGLRFLRRATRELDEADEKILHNVTLSVRSRFAHLLVVLIERYGTENDDGSLILELPLSRQDLASMIGTTPESMSRTIRKMEDDGIAHFTGRSVRIPTREILINEFEPDVFI